MKSYPPSDSSQRHDWRGGLNLFHVVASYNGIFSIGATADRNALPDPATYAECMETAFQELLAAAG